MSFIKKFLCIAVSLMLVVSLASCDDISEELFEELIDYLDEMAEASTDAVTDNYIPPKSPGHHHDEDDEDDDDDYDDDYDGTTESDPKEDSEADTESRDTTGESDTGATDCRHNIVHMDRTEPTCVEIGCAEGWFCEICGEVFSGFEEIPMVDHKVTEWEYLSFADLHTDGLRKGSCNTCGMGIEETLKASVGLTYTSNGDGKTCYVSGMGECTDTEIVIPKSFNGQEVTGIGSCAFESHREITSVVIPYGVTSIGSSAFSWCEQMEYINIPGTVESIGDSAFWYCFKITEIDIPDGITYIGEGAFGCTGITELEIAEDNPYYHIAGNCLIDTENKALILGFADSVIPDDGSVECIAANAFAGCGELKSIVIPESVVLIGAHAFYCCGGLESITFENGLISIGYNVFNACNSLKTIVIPDSVMEIGDSAFTWCSGIETVVIGKGVSYIGHSAFNQCASLKNVYYVGSEAQWNEINKGNGWDSNAGDYTLHFNYVP